MAFTAPHAYDLLCSAFSQKRMPHALLVTGDETAGAQALCLDLVRMINPDTRGDSLETLRDEYCRVVRPRSKSRRILIEDIRSIEPFLRQKAAPGRWKIVLFLDAERMNEEAANAFLKTLEEPPNHSLIILVTSKPELLLQTILSRCVAVRLYSPGSTPALTSVQQTLLPAWAEACRHIGSDVTALGFRSELLRVLSERKAEITKSFTQALKEEAKASSQGTETNLESQNKDLNAALIETEYLAERDTAIDLFVLWFGQAALMASGTPVEHPLHPGVAEMASSLPVADIMRRMEAVEQMKHDLRFNIHEGLCVDVRMLEALGSTDRV